MTTANTLTVNSNGTTLVPTLHFRYKEVGKPEILLNMYMPPELKLQQLWEDATTGVQEWKDIPRVPYTAPDTE